MVEMIEIFYGKKNYQKCTTKFYGVKKKMFQKCIENEIYFISLYKFQSVFDLDNVYN
jgi:hypothetical protein